MHFTFSGILYSSVRQCDLSLYNSLAYTDYRGIPYSDNTAIVGLISPIYREVLCDSHPCPPNTICYCNLTPLHTNLATAAVFGQTADN